MTASEKREAVRASERLRALGSHPIMSAEAISANVAVLTALPLIADVVEAAEAGEDALRIHGRGPELIVSRHALDVALTALRDALEGDTP